MDSKGRFRKFPAPNMYDELVGDDIILNICFGGLILCGIGLCFLIPELFFMLCGSVIIGLGIRYFMKLRR